VPVTAGLRDGVHVNPDPEGRPEWFTLAYVHRPEELVADRGDQRARRGRRPRLLGTGAPTRYRRRRSAMYAHLLQPSPARGRGLARRPAPPTATGRLLRLQETIGNRAVGRLLARQPLGAPDTEQLDADGARSGATATVPDVGTIAIDSFSWSIEGRGPPTSATVSSRQGPHSPRLMQASLSGKAGDIVITMVRRGYIVTYTLHEALISSYLLSGDTESWSINFTSMEYKTEATATE
jgi:hypothetical protein